MTLLRSALVLVLTVAASAVTLAVPSAATNLQAVVSGTTVTFSWTASPGATAYQLEAGSAAGLSDLATITLSATPTYTVPGVPAGVYFVRVRALDGSGASAPSNEVTVVVGGTGGPCVSAPDAPTRLRAVVDGTQVSLSWAPAVAGCPATNYIIRAGSHEGAVDLAQIPVPSAGFSAVAPDGIYFVSVVAVNPYGVSAPSGSIVVVVAAANSGGRVGFNTTTPAIVTDEQGNAVVIAEVVNRSLVPAVFIEISAALRTASGQVVPAGSTFLRGQPRRLSATGVIDDSALAPGEIGCVYLPTSITAGSVVGASLQVAHDSFASTPLRTRVDVVDFDRVATPGAATLAVTAVNAGAERSFYNLANLYLKRSDGRAIGCDFTFVPTADASLSPGQVISFTAVTHAPESASTAVAWMHWQEAGDPLAGLAAQTYEQMRRSVASPVEKRQALAAWYALQQQRRALARQAGQ
jgi:hypothetical protein